MFSGPKRNTRQSLKRLAIADEVKVDSSSYSNSSQVPSMDTMFEVDGVKYMIKTSTIPNVGKGLFAQENIKANQFLMFYKVIKLDYNSWKTMCANNPRVKVYSMVEDPNVDKQEDLFYIYGDVTMGNIAGYINSSITCRQKENVEYELYPGIPPWKTFQ